MIMESCDVWPTGVNYPDVRPAKERKKLYNAEYWRKNRERLVANGKKYYAEHKEEAKIRCKKYKDSHREEIKAMSRKYYLSHKEEIGKKGKKYAAEHREQQRMSVKKCYRKHREERRGHSLRVRHGLSVEEYSVLFESQGMCCAICGEINTDSRGMHVDHDHITGKIRGILCRRCNMTLGMICDNAEIAKRMIEYIEKFQHGEDNVKPKDSNNFCM